MTHGGSIAKKIGNGVCVLLTKAIEPMIQFSERVIQCGMTAKRENDDDDYAQNIAQVCQRLPKER